MQEHFPLFEGSIPWLSEEQMREVDRAMVEDYCVALLQMMEHAGSNIAAVARSVFFDGLAAGKKVVIAAGPGGNGGGGLSGGRQLHNMGADITVVLAAPVNKLIPQAATQLRTLQASGVPVVQAGELDLTGIDLIVDAIFGYSLRADPRGDAATLIDQIVASGIPVLSNDIPSGIESSSGRVGSPAIRATATITIAMPKKGLTEPDAKPLIGELYLGNIAVPPDLYPRSFPGMALDNPFETSDVVRIW